MADQGSWDPLGGRQEPPPPVGGPPPARPFAQGPFGQGPLGPPSAPARPDDLLAPVVAHRPTKLRNVLAVAFAAALVGGGTAASLTLAGGDNGASSPQGAVQALYSAVEGSDVIGALDALDPGERAAIEPGLEDIFDQLKRLGVLSSGADLGHLSGLSVHYGPLDMTTDQLTSTVAAVTVAGTSETDTVDPTQLPLGSLITGLGIGSAHGVGAPTTTTTQDGPTVMGTVEVDGGWYVSLGYSMAINILKEDGASAAPAPAGQGLQPEGASSPQGAVQELFSSIANLDLSSLVGDLPPDEMAALDAYSPDWLPQAQAALGRLQGKLHVDFTDLDLSTEQVDSGTLVKVGSGLRFDVSGGGINVSYADGCARLSVLGTTRAECGDAGAGTAELRSLLQDMPAAVAPIFQRLATTPPDLGFVTVEERGQWYVSPTRTLLQAVVAGLSEFRAQDLTTIADNAEAVEHGFTTWLDKQVQGQLGTGGLGTGPPAAGILGI